MICKRCGAENPEDVTFCVECGESLTRPKEPKKKMDPEKKKKLFRLGAVLVAVVCIVALAVSVFSGNEAESAAEDLCDALIELDFNSALTMLPPAVLDYASDSLDLEHVKYEIIRSEELDDDSVRNIDDRYALRLGTEDGYISAAYVVYLRAAVSGKSISRDKIPLIMVEIDGHWYLDPLTTLDELEEADFYEDAFHINWN